MIPSIRATGLCDWNRLAVSLSVSLSMEDSLVAGNSKVLHLTILDSSPDTVQTPVV